MTEQEKEGAMPQHMKSSGGAAPALGGAFWFAGWLFTSAFANLIWWKWIVGLVIWPYYLGLAVR